MSPAAGVATDDDEAGLRRRREAFSLSTTHSPALVDSTTTRRSAAPTLRSRPVASAAQPLQSTELCRSPPSAVAPYAAGIRGGRARMQSGVSLRGCPMIEVGHDRLPLTLGFQTVDSGVRCRRRIARDGDVTSAEGASALHLRRHLLLSSTSPRSHRRDRPSPPPQMMMPKLPKDAGAPVCLCRSSSTPTSVEETYIFESQEIGDLSHGTRKG